jgi:hypothetical protein
LIVLLVSLKNNWIFGNATRAFCRIARAATLVCGRNPLFLSPFPLLVMKTIKIFAAAACAQTTPAAGTMQSGTTSPSGTMQSGTMNGQTGTDRMQTGTMQNGTMQNGTMKNGTMQNGSMNGKMDRKTKMNDRKGMKKTKMSTTPSTTGTM